MNRSSGASSTWVIGAGVMVVVACGMAGYLLQASRHPASDVAPLGAGGFDINYVPPAASARPAPAPAVTPSPAPAVASSPAPLPPPRSAAPASAPAAAAQPSGAAKALSSIKQLLSSPGQYLVSQTYFASPAKLQGFLRDQKRMSYYLANPITRAALDSPALTKLLAHPAVAHAFIASPAMSDDATVSALVRSPLFAQIVRSPGVQEALADPALVSGLMQDPQMAQWLGKHPSATVALNQSMAALGR